MIIIKTATALRTHLEKAASTGSTIGFVPTMGALHQGHISLIDLSRSQNQLTVCSIFVNPTQFNDSKDFEKYPKTIESDIVQLERAGCDVLFLPSVQEVYPNGTDQLPSYELGYLEEILEGKYRPGHFQGVCMVVHRLLNLVLPDTLYLGQKDYQQCMVLKRLTQTVDFGQPIHITFGPTLREKSGLAMSSRNMRLSDEDKNKATAIFKAMQFVQENIKTQEPPALQQMATEQLLESGFEKVDYVAICNADTLQPVMRWNGKDPLVVLVAAFLGGVRLIDNMLLD